MHPHQHARALTRRAPHVCPQGTCNLVALAQRRGFKHVVLITSIGADDLLNPLNAFWGVLFWKKRAEEVVQRSGLPYTIVRPGGLKSRLRPGESEGNMVMARPGCVVRRGEGR